MNPLSQFLLDRMKRSLLASAGLILFAFGFYMQLAANIGLSPWTALNQGLSNHLPITFGQASILVSVLIIVSDLLMREAIGIGTILDALLVGWASDLFIALEPIPYQEDFLPGLLVLFVGTVILCVGQWIYMLAALSCGPRDAFLVALGKRLPRLSIGTVNILLCLAVSIIAFFLGGQLGLGTILTLFGTGVLMDIVYKIVKFEPRNVEHESLLGSLSALRQALKAGSPRA